MLAWSWAWEVRAWGQGRRAAGEAGKVRGPAGPGRSGNQGWSGRSCGVVRVVREGMKLGGG